MQLNDLTVVIPVLNERAFTMIDMLHSVNTWFDNPNIIFVDDHSDNRYTLYGFDVLKNVPNVSVIKNKGCGQEMALYTGITNSNTPYIACIDCDGQDPVSALRTMYNTIKQTDSLAVAGIRETRGDSILRIVCANIYHFLFQKKLGRKVPAISNFFIIHKDLKEKINPQYVRGVIYLTSRVHYVPYERLTRRSGKSKFTLVKLCKVAKAGFQFAKAGEKTI